MSSSSATIAPPDAFPAVTVSASTLSLQTPSLANGMYCWYTVLQRRKKYPPPLSLLQKEVSSFQSPATEGESPECWVLSQSSSKCLAIIAILREKTCLKVINGCRKAAAAEGV